MIFHDEISVNGDGPFVIGDETAEGSLICRSDTNIGVTWLYRNVMEVPIAGMNTDSAPFFQQIQEVEGGVSSSKLVRFSMDGEEPNHRTNGIWICQVTGISEGEYPVGIFRRGDKLL